MKINSSEKGQALIIITFAAVGLFAFAALAIDGGMVFSDRRHSQNASDTAVLASALARARATANWEQTGWNVPKLMGIVTRRVARLRFTCAAIQMRHVQTYPLALRINTFRRALLPQLN